MTLFLNVLFFNERSLINSERRVELANGILTETFHVLCFCQAQLTKEVQNSDVKQGEDKLTVQRSLLKLLSVHMVAR